MPSDARRVMRVKPTPASELSYLGSAVSRKLPTIRQECRHADTSISRPAPHLVVEKLGAFFAETCSMYSITAEKSKSPYLLRDAVFTSNAVDVAGIAA
jgi:hypothetical protein